MIRRILLSIGSAITLLVIATSVALAGGAATVVLDEMPAEVHAGDPLRLEFAVWQHGQRPVDEFEGVGPVRPVLYATNAETGESLRVEGYKDEGAEVGRFAVDVTFPSEGTWTWYIDPEPFELMNGFEPLTVGPALAASAPAGVAAAISAPGTLRAALQIGGATLIGAALLLAVGRQRQRPSARPSVTGR